MPRPPGTRNQDFAEKRDALIDKLTAFVLQEGVELPSFRQLAIAAETSEPTLRHYFKDRSGVIVAIMACLNEMSAFMREATRTPSGSIEESVEEYITLISNFRTNTRFIQAHMFGMRESMSDAEARKAYLDYIIEPSVDALAERLVKTKGGPTNYQSARAAAMMLMSSSQYMLIHQNLLEGAEHNPIDVDWYFGLVRNWILDGMERNPEGLDSDAG
ncbi:MAG: hypothetical protein RIB03_05405 [Henriciella sp.]|uniref:TetR/AcrR family transcriptional regulator n=1 Tax=Henriciella sp. TaxID=1968823 RepID=UPI0032ECC4C0